VLAVFYIDWKDIQIQLRDPGSLQIYNGNGSRAKSEGIELSLDANPLAGLNVTTWVSWNRAELTEDFPPGPAIGRSGDRLPYSPRLSGGLSIEQEFPVGASLTGFVGSSATYVGDRVGVFRTVDTRQTFGSYKQIDLRLGVRNDGWSVNAFANNLTDERGLLRGGLDRPAALNYAFDYIQPRTIGLAITKDFGR
jgi:outer membrane receptor protein involved in Fe transport